MSHSQENVSKSVSSGETASNRPIGKDGKPLKPCCVCLETKGARDECIINKGEEHCGDFIEAHKQCMRDLGFKI